MIKEIWERIKSGEDVRQNLSALRMALKENRDMECLKELQKESLVLAEYLKNEDAKTRKNTALLIGELKQQECLDALFHAYLNEKQMFVKSSYLTALKGLDYGKYLDQIKERLRELGESRWDADQDKHIREEMRELSALVLLEEGASSHAFKGWKEACSVILLTNRNFPELTQLQLQELEPGARTKLFGAGVMAKVDNLLWCNSIRTYQELLFSIDGMSNCPMDVDQAAKVIISSDLLGFLGRTHEGDQSYCFRIEIKSRMDGDKKGVFVKKLSSLLELQSGRKLINAPSDYQVEIRLIENKEGSFNLLVKLYTLKDTRFTYRKEVSPYSLKPVNAALTVELAKPYMTENARVLDPFCGVGTMLIERHKALEADTSYGVDIQGDFIEKARENAEAARQVIHFINRDFFDFTHEYPFDEIITDMPFPMGRISESEIEQLYRNFFKYAKNLLKKDGIAVLYTRNREFVNKYAKTGGFALLKHFECSAKEGTYVYILRLG